VTALLSELAGHVADGVEVDWRAVERRGGSSARTIANLETIARRAEASGALQLHRSEAQRGRRSFAIRHWEAALLSMSGLRTLLSIFGSAVHPATQARDLALIQLAIGGSCLLAAMILLRGGLRDRRAVALAGVLLTGAAGSTWPLYHRFSAHLDPRALDPLLVFLPEAFVSYWIWSFVAVFPRRRVAARGDQTITLIRRLALGWGALLLVANAAASLWPRLQPGLRAFERSPSSFGFWGVIGVSSLLAFPAMLLSTRRAEPDERRRTTAFVLAVAFGFVPLFVIEVWAMIVQPGPPSSTALAFELLPTLTVPFTTAYGVLARRILPLGALLHQFGRYLLARATLNLLLALPLIAGVAMLAMRRDEPIGAVLGGRLGGWMAVMAAAALLATLVRARLLAGLDRAFNRESRDWHGQLALVARGLVAAVDAEALISVLRAEVARPLGARSLDLLRSSGEEVLFRPLASGAPPLAADAGVALLSFASDYPLIVDPVDEKSAFWWLPEEDRRWVVDADASLLVPLALGGRQCGLFVIGPRLANREYECEELQFLAAVAASLAVALDRLRFEPLPPPPEAAECVSCGRVGSAGEPCACGGSTTSARLPLVFAGRYRLERLLGRGAMGVVYQAHDEELGRRVALKTLPELSAEESVRLRLEARSMASVPHPNVAIVYDIERWKGRPVLVEECLTMGTLAERLSEPMPAGDAARLGRQLAGALATMHGHSVVHRDLKPSNIGYSDSGDPKILDFGLADLIIGAGASIGASDARRGQGRNAGTPRYLPPEAWHGQQVGAEGDLWALAMLLYECLDGAHPLSGVAPESWIEALAVLPRPGRKRGDCPDWLSDLVLKGLCPNPGARWPSAAWVKGCLEPRGGLQD
jgi:hypothetical protein